MKRKLLCLSLFLLATFSYAQIFLEHTYRNDWTKRMILEFSGEKYCEFKKTTNELLLYNSDHSLWKTINIPGPISTSTEAVRIMHVSEAIFNDDSNVEVVVCYGMSPQEGKVISENGVVLFNLPSCKDLLVSKLEGSENKLVAHLLDGSSCVYNLPSLTLEHTFEEGYIQRVNLEYSGAKYYLLNKAAQLVKVYNLDFSDWKSISVALPVNLGYPWSYYSDIVLLTELELSGNFLIKVGFNCRQSNPFSTSYLGKIIDENGVEIISINNCSGMHLSVIDGLESKFIADLYYYGWDGGWSKTNIYSIPSLSLERSYYGDIRRTVLEYSGEKYYTSSFFAFEFGLALDTSVKIYNSDHSLYKSIPLLVLPGTSVLNVDLVSENKIAADPLIELGYCQSSNSEQWGYEWNGLVINENGHVYLDTPGAFYYEYSNYDTLQTKLLANRFILENGDSRAKATNVYSLNPTMGISKFDINRSTITPNPVKDNLKIASNLAIVEATIFDIKGITVGHFKDLEIKTIPFNSISAGLYVLQLKDVNGDVSIHKVVVAP